jgi:hypothetical protein
MPALDIFRHYDTVQFLRQHETARQAARETARTAKSEESVATKPAGETSLSSTFEDILDIVNPLQHLPVVGTLYRAMTGDKMGTLPKIAGDTLYGGLWGAVGSLADTAFEAVTGKDFGATVLALITGSEDDKPVALAQNLPAKTALPAGGEELAFSNALSARGIDSDLSARALYAYRRSQGLTETSPGMR